MIGFKTRKELAQCINVLNPNIAVEVGVRQGHYSEYILMATNVKKLYSIDPWDLNAELGNPEEAYNICQQKLSRFGDRVVMQIGRSPDICEMFEDASIDFVYIDALHDYESVKKDINGWYPKVRKGGILSGHDYTPTHQGVIDAVNEFCKEHSYELQLTGVDWQDGSIVSGYPEPSWWLVKK